MTDEQENENAENNAEAQGDDEQDTQENQPEQTAHGENHIVDIPMSRIAAVNDLEIVLADNPKVHLEVVQLDNGLRVARISKPE